MAQAWIHKPKTDLLFIIGPTWLSLLLVLLFHRQFTELQEQYNTLFWLVLIVFIDVAHVYATLFKTYLNRAYRRENRKLLLGLPLFCFVLGLTLMAFGQLVFWSFLAYVAVFHFVRQQYGFFKIYARFEAKPMPITDTVTIYAATIYPMLYWFLSPARNFNWFLEDEFFTSNQPLLRSILGYAYVAILLLYHTKVVRNFIQTKSFNWPKNLLLWSTALSWYFGIVHFNNDLIFTLLNVVSHGIPYMALVYVRTQSSTQARQTRYTKYVAIFIAVLLCLGLAEELLWEGLVWQEHLTFPIQIHDSWQFLWVPLLSVPQFTHYLLDGFIWKSAPK